jgi:hypothetical protein
MRESELINKPLKNKTGEFQTMYLRRNCLGGVGTSYYSAGAQRSRLQAEHRCTMNNNG